MGSHTGLALEGEIDAPGRDEEAAIVYTSAMAGTALGAVLTHRNLLANAHAAVEAVALDTNTVSLALLPFSHLFGFSVSLMAPLLAGGRVITMARFNPIRALEMIRTERVTLFTGVPSVFAGLLAALVARRRQAWAQRAERLHLRRRAAQRGAAAPMGGRHRRAAPPGLRTHRSGPRLPLQSPDAPEPPRHPRHRLPRRGGRAAQPRDLRARRECVPGLPPRRPAPASP